MVGDTNQHMKDLIKEEEVKMVIDGDDDDMGDADDWLIKYMWLSCRKEPIHRINQEIII